MTKRALTLALAGMVAVVASACGTGGEAANEVSSYTTVEVSRGNLSIRAEATGTVEPIRTVEVKSRLRVKSCACTRMLGIRLGPDHS